MYKIHARDKRKWFQIHCCNGAPTGDLPLMGQPDIGMAIGFAMAAIITVMLLGALAHHLGLATAGVILANAPVADIEIKGKLDALLAQTKEYKEKGEAEQKKFGTMLEETVTKLTALQKQADALDVKLAERHVADTPNENVYDDLAKDELLIKFMHDRPKTTSYIRTFKGKQAAQILEYKTTVDTAAVGRSTSGVMPIDRTPGIVQEARQTLKLRDLLRSRPTSLSDIDYVKVNSAMSRASVQTESSAKFENAVTFNTGTARVQTIATLIPASRQVLDDMPELQSYLEGALGYNVNLAEEAQFLTGSNTGNDLNGLATQGTAYNTALNTNSPGWKQQDIVARAIQQIMIAKELDPSFVVLHPTDYWNIKLTKDTQGRYLNSGLGLLPTAPFFGLDPVVTTTIGSGSFLVGSGNPAAVEIRDRMELTIEISMQHSDWFAKNLIAIRAEKRAALVCYRPGSFVTGSFNTSP